MHRQLRSRAIRGMWLTGAAVAGFGAIGLGAQEVLDLPAEDLPLSADFELVYRIGSAAAQAEWQEFTAIEHIGFDGTGSLRMLDGAGFELSARIVTVDAAGRYVNAFGRRGDGPGEFGIPRQMVVWPDGSMLVTDLMRRGSLVFDPAGDFERLVRGEAGSDSASGAHGWPDCGGWLPGSFGRRRACHRPLRSGVERSERPHVGGRLEAAGARAKGAGTLLSRWRTLPTWRIW